MRRLGVLRCPYCCLELGREDGGPLLPGHLIVCRGCVAPSAFDGAGERLAPLELGGLTTEVRDAVSREQQRIKTEQRASGGWDVPAGYSWQRGALCEGCWGGFERGREPTRVLGVPSSRCAFCGQKTDAGIFRRMLLPLG